MDELEKMLQSGIIDFKTYEELRKKLDPTYKQEYERAKESVTAAQEFVQQEKSRGLGSVNIGGDVDKNIYMTPDELETYTSRGIEPTYGVDYENIRAERQTWQDQLANGAIKFVGKTATGVAGGLGMIPTIAIVGLGQLTDMVSGQNNFQFKDIYDNDYQRLMDSANEAMDSALPNYVTNAEREASVLSSMGTMNFWANDLLGGASFVASALLTEYLTAGMASGLAVGRAGKYLKELSTASKLEDVVTQASKFSGGVFPPGLQMNRAAKLARQVATGAGYEAAVEARHFVDQAKEQYINDYIQANGQEPSPEEIAAAMDDIHSVGNGVFGTNLALVSLGNMVTLPKTFAPGLASKFGIKAGKVTDADWVVRPSELTDTQLARMAKKTGKSIDELKATDFVNKWDGLSKIERLARAGKGRFAPMVTEGFFEEGLQGVTQNAALDYISNRLNPDNINEVADLSESVIRGFEEQYDVSKAEGWKEIIIGSILGGVGAPNIGRAKGQPMWQGGVFGYQSPSKRENIQSLIGDAIKYGKATTENIKHAATVAGATKRQDDAIAQGDMFEAKNQEYASMYSYVSTMVKLGRFDEIDSEVSKMVEKMSADEFGEQFGYTNLTEEELGKRKTEVLSTFRQRANDIREARELAEKVSIYEDDEDLKDGLGYVFGISKNIDAREDQMFKTLQQKLGLLYDKSTIKEFASFVEFQKTTSSKLVNEYTNKINELEKLTADELKANKNKTSKQIMDRGKEIDRLTNEISAVEDRLEKEFSKFLQTYEATGKGEALTYNRDKQKFKTAYNNFLMLQDEAIKNVGEDFYNRPDIKPVLDDLMKLATYRQQQITLANYYMTKKGQTKLANEIDNLKKMAADELVSDELNISSLQSVMAGQLDTRMQDVAARAYKKKQTGTNPNETYNPSEEIESINNILQNLPNGPQKDQFLRAMQIVNEKLNSKNIDDIEPYLNNIYTELFNSELGDTPEGKQILDRIRFAFDEIISYLKAPKTAAAISSINRFFRVYIPEEVDQYLANTFTHPSDFTVKLEEIDPEDPYVKQQEESNRIVFLKDEEKNKILTPFVAMQSLIKHNGKYYAIKLMHENNFVGYILDPNRYKFKNPNINAYEDFNPKSLAHLRLINPAFVSKDKITTEGLEFIEAYTQGMKMFKFFLDKIDEGASKVGTRELLENGFLLFDSKFNKYDDGVPGELIKELRDKPELYNLVPMDEPRGIEVREGEFVKAPFIQVKVGNSIDYYYYDRTDDSVKRVIYQGGIDKLNTLLKINSKSSQFGINSSRNFIKIIKPSDTGFSPISVRIPTINLDDENSSFINDFKNYIDQYIGKKKGEFRYKSNFFNTNIVGYTEGDDSINLKLYLDPVNSKGSQFLKLQVYYNGKFADIILDEVDNVLDIKNGKELLDLINKELKKKAGKMATAGVQLPKSFVATGFNYATKTADIKSILETGIPTLLSKRGIVYKPKEIQFKDKPDETTKESTGTYTKEDFLSPEEVEEAGGFVFEDEPASEEQPQGTKDTTTEDTTEDTSKKDTEEDDDFIPPFKIDERTSDYEESLESRQEKLEGMLPTWIPIRDLEQIRNKFKNKGFTYGVFIDSVIYLSKNAPKGVEYHEAFHAVFRTLLNDAQISKVLQEAVSRYGKPTDKDINNLRSKSAEYSNLNLDSLVKLWYEEKLADEFQEYMLKDEKPKTFIQKMFDLIKKFIGWASSNRGYIDGLFKDIKRGVYKNALPVKNQYYQKSLAVFKTLEFEEEYEGAKRTRTLDSRTTSNIANKILKKAFDLSKISEVTDLDIKDIIENLKNNYYTEENFEELFKQSTPAKVNSAKKQLAQVRNALSNPKNINDLVKDVQNLLSMYKIVDYTLEPDDDQDNQELPTEFFAKEVSTIGGIGSLSKEMRKYLQFIPSPVDEFDLGVTIDPSSQFVSYADSYELYNGIARILANRKPSDIIKALYSQSKTNEQLKYFTVQIFSDIAKDLNLTNYSPKEISELGLLTLEKSTTFQMFVANFRKNKIDYISITPDVESNKFKLFRSNINDVKDIQVDSWGNANLSNPVSSADQGTLLNKLRNTFRNIKEGEESIKNLKQFVDTVEKIKSELNALHIDVSDLYIRLSLFNSIPNKLDLAALDNEGTFENLSETLSVYPEVLYLNDELFTSMSNATTNGGSIYQKVEGKDSGAISRLKNIAEANSYFDFAVIPTTFKNIEGKTIYSYIQPNYITDIVNSLKDNPDVIIDALNDPNPETGYITFRDFLIANNLESNDFLQRKFYNSLRYNPQLSSIDAKTFLSGLNAFILDGSRVVTLDDNYKEVTYLSNDDGKTFQSLDPRGKILTYFMLYSTKGGQNSMVKTVDGVEFVPYIPFQNEGKNTQWAVSMPKVKDAFTEGKVSKEAYDKIFKIFQLEHNNLLSFFESLRNDEQLPTVKGVTEFKDIELKQTVVNALKNDDFDALSEIYKTRYKELPRAMKFSNIEFLFNDDNIDYLIKSAFDGFELELNDEVKSSINKLVNSITNETLEMLSSDNIKLISKVEEGKYTNVLLPREFLFDNGDVDVSKLKNFLINDYINSVSFINMLVGDMAFNFKDAIDFPKRMAGLNASGPSLGLTKTNVTIIKDVEGIHVDLETGKVVSKERTDGQSYSTQSWYERKYLRTFKKWNPEIERIYKKMRKCQKLSWSEKEFLENYGALANSRKIAMFNYAVYGKTSINPIVRNEVSFVKPENYKEVNELVERLYKTDDIVEYKKILTSLHKYYEPYPQARKMHELLNKMELSDTDIALSESAVKTVVYNSQDSNTVKSFDNIIMGDTYIREQVVTDGMKTKVVDPTQLLQLIDSEQKPGTKVNVLGKEYDIETIVNVFKKTKEYRVKQKYEELKKSYVEGNKPRYKALLKSFRESLLNMGTDPIMLELLSASENLDSSKYNWNMNKTISTVEKMLYSYLSASLSHKVAGQKFTLLTDDAYKVMEDSNGNIVTMDDFKNNPIEDYTTRDLEVKYDSVKKCYYAECVISPQTAYKYGLKPGDTIPANKKLLELIGTRIPTQEKSSMAYLKVVDYLPVEKGNSIILPFEIMYYSGADFDIDSLFTQTYETYENEDGNEVIYGNYLDIDEQEARLNAAFDEYYNHFSEVKSVRADYDKYIETDEKLAKYYDELEYSKNALKLALMRNIFDLIDFVQQEMPEFEESIKEEFNKHKDFHKTLSFVLKNTTALDIKKENIDLIKSLSKKIKERKKELLNVSLKRNNYISTLEDFKNNIDLVKKVNNNYNAVKKGDLLEYTPLNTSETNNFMLELKMVLVKNEGNKEASRRDVEREDAKKLTEMLKEFGIKDPTEISHYSSLTSKVKMSMANAVGGKNIGIAALGNIMAQYLIRNKAVIGNVGVASDFNWKGNNESINKILSLWITLGVDNAKHQDAGRFYITSQMQSVFVFDAIINKDSPSYSSKHIMALGLLPRVKQMLNEISFSTENFKTKSEEKRSLTKTQILASYSKPSSVNWNNLTLDQILNTVKKLENGEEVDPEFEQAAINKIVDLMKIADYSIPFTQLLGLIKGNKATSAENFLLLDTLNSLGIEIKNGELVNTQEYIYSKNSEKDVHPIDFLSIIKSDPFLKQEILTFNNIINDSGMFLIPASSYGQKLYKKILKNLKKSFMFNESNPKRLVYLMNNSLAFAALRHEQSLNNQRATNTTEFVTFSPEDLPKYIKVFNELKSSNLLTNNYFLKNLKASFVEGREGSPLDGLTVHYISTNSRLNISPNMKKKIADDMYDLFVGNVYNTDGSLNKDLSTKAKYLIGTIINQIYQKDAGLFQNETLLPYTEPFFLSNYSAALDKVQQAISGEKSFKDVLGMTSEEFSDMFMENYMRDFNNSILIRGNRIDFILGNIKNELINNLKNLENLEDADIQDVIEKIKKLDSDDVKAEDYELISPIKFNEDKTKFTLMISPEFSNENRTTLFFDKERVKTLGSLYRSALAKTGLVNFNYEYKDSKVIRKTEFLDYLIISQKVGKKTVRKYYKRVNEDNWKADYVEVAPFGSKAFLHYFRTPTENEQIFASLKDKTVKKTEDSKKSGEVTKTSSTASGIEITKVNYTRQEVQNNPKTAYIFTENTHSITAFPNKQGGGSAVIRPEPNAYAIVTKKKYDYNTGENVDYTDTPENFKEFTEINTKLINNIKNSGKSKIIFPQGFATDKAKMPTRFAEWLQKALLDNFGLVTELNSTKTGLISKSIQPIKTSTSTPLPGKSSDLVKGLYTFLNDVGILKTKLINISSLEDFTKNFSPTVKKVFDMIQSSGKMAQIKNRAINGEEFEGAKATFPGSKEFLKFAEAYEQNKLDEIINKCRQ
jgi:hypothetical protein